MLEDSSCTMPGMNLHLREDGSGQSLQQPMVKGYFSDRAFASDSRAKAETQEMVL